MCCHNHDNRERGRILSRAMGISAAGPMDDQPAEVGYFIDQYLLVSGIPILRVIPDLLKLHFVLMTNIQYRLCLRYK